LDTPLSPSRLDPVIRLGDLEISPPVMLAPMAGLTHSALRRLVARFGGTGLFYTEMLSARALPQEVPELSPYLIRSSEERPLDFQLLVSEKEQIAPAVEVIEGLDAQAVDLNMGCTAPPVRRRGAGCTLLSRQEQAEALVAELRSMTDLPVTIKIRLLREEGWGRKEVERWLVAFCTRLQDAGADMIAIHARFVKEPFSRPAKWGVLACLKGRLSIPYVVNGGIESPEDARRALSESGAAGVMVGRAAVRRPWLLAEIASDIYGTATALPERITPDFLSGLYLSFARDLADRFPPERQLGRLKEFTHYFAANYLFGHTLAYGVQRAKTMEQAMEVFHDFFEKSGHQLAGVKK